DFRQRQPEPAAIEPARGFEPLINGFGNVAGDRKADAAKGVADDRRVDPDQPARRIDQRPPTVTRIDCRIALHEILITRARLDHAMLAAEEPERHGPVQAKGAADRPYG